MAKIRRLQHCVLNCRDVEASKTFYTEVLGTEVVRSGWQSPGDFLRYDAGRSQAVVA